MGVTANLPKSDDKYAQKSVELVRVSSFQSDFLQKKSIKKIYVSTYDIAKKKITTKKLQKLWCAIFN